MRFVNYSNVNIFNEEIEILNKYVENKMNILSIHTQPFLKFSFSILKKDEIYKVMIETIETQKNKTLILKIFDSKDNLLLTFDRMLMKISIYNQRNENFIVPLKFNFSDIDSKLENFIIETIDFRDQTPLFICYFNRSFYKYQFKTYLEDSKNDIYKIFYHLIFIHKFQKTNVNLDTFLKNPISIYELENILSY